MGRRTILDCSKTNRGSRVRNQTLRTNGNLPERLWSTDQCYWKMRWSESCQELLEAGYYHFFSSVKQCHLSFNIIRSKLVGKRLGELNNIHRENNIMLRIGIFLRNSDEYYKSELKDSEEKLWASPSERIFQVRRPLSSWGIYDKYRFETQ